MKISKIFIICPVRNVTKIEKGKIEQWVSSLEARNIKVHWPQRDTDQKDDIGLRICEDNKEAISNADEIHIYWNKDSKGSLFDIGMAFSLNKPIKIINREDVKKTPHKSFENVLLELDRIRSLSIAHDEIVKIDRS